MAQCMNSPAAAHHGDVCTPPATTPVSKKCAVLRDEMRNRGIECLEFAPAIELILDEAGLSLRGGPREHRDQRNHSRAGEGGHLDHRRHWPAAYPGLSDHQSLRRHRRRAGAWHTGPERNLIYIDTMQYHPTGVAYPIQIEGQLVTEKVRTLGAQLTDVDGAQFIMPLEPRDVVSAAIIRECRDNRGIDTPTGQVGVWLDSPMIDLIRGEGTIGRELPAMVRQFARYGIDITREPMLVYPTLHYQNGGIKIGVNGETNVARPVRGRRSIRRRSRPEQAHRQLHP